MESYESILGSEWSALNAMHSTEESDFMAQLLNYCSIPNDLHSGSYNTDVDHFSGGTSFYHPTSNPDSYYAGVFDHILATCDDFVLCNEEVTEENKSSVELLSRANVHENVIMQLEQEDQVPDSELNKDVVFRKQKSKKRSTNSRDVQENKRNVKAKKKQKHTKTNCTNKEQNGILLKQSSSSCSSENDSIASHELIGVASNSSESKEATTINSNGQLRAVRGSATDPQSLYARKRRERINERLRTLQKLVPNGTKVDISTMLEDAVEYVKFLQLQIKLLSSDDKWMYAPIAYNGTDVRT